MTQAIEKVTSAQIQNRTSKIASMALPLVQDMIPNAKMQLASLAVYLHQNEELALCDPVSIQGAILKCCQLGLMPGGAFNHIYWIPRFNKKKGIQEIDVQPSFFGLKYLAEKCGFVNWKHAAIFDTDDFEYEDSFDLTSFRHKRKLGSKKGNVIGAFAACEDLNFKVVNDLGQTINARKLKVIDREDIDRARNAAKQDFVWSKHFEAMAVKTAIRRMCKDLNLDRTANTPTGNLLAAIEMENAEPQDNIKLVSEVTGEPVEKKHEDITAEPNMFEQTKELLSDAIKNGFNCKDSFGADAKAVLEDCKTDEDCITIAGIVKNAMEVQE